MLYILLPLVIVIAWLRYRFYRQTTYRHSLTGTFKKSAFIHTHPRNAIFFIIRFLTLLILALLIARPQWVNVQSKVPVEAISIILLLDLSGSMQFQDDGDNRSRVEVAKIEAVRFIEKRINDAIGLVIFGKDALSRCPITHDKKLLKDMVNDLNIGVIDPDGTMLATAIITAANRLKHVKTKSKVMILLTDGEPSEGDMNPDMAVEIAKKMGIKIYTVGIGSEQEEVFVHPLYGIVAKPKVNSNLLKKIARETNGQFFMAHNARDMRTIYDTIDQLEKTKLEVPIFSDYHDIFFPVVLSIVALILTELGLSTFMWFGI